MSQNKAKVTKANRHGIPLQNLNQSVAHDWTSGLQRLILRKEDAIRAADRCRVQLQLPGKQDKSVILKQGWSGSLSDVFSGSVAHYMVDCADCLCPVLSVREWLSSPAGQGGPRSSLLCSIRLHRPSRSLGSAACRWPSWPLVRHRV